MRYAIIADVHGNLEALTAVLNDIESMGGADEYWCLGDVVGYGPDPHECIQVVKSLNCRCVAGNHDRGTIGQLDVRYFNPIAAEVLEWTKGQLTASDFSWLNSLPETLTEGEFLLVHGSPRKHFLEYINSISLATQNFEYFSGLYCLCSHTHVPRVYIVENAETVSTTKFNEFVKLFVRTNRLLINPGSVGQPRDKDNRASYIYYDNEPSIMQIRRVPYERRITQEKIMELGLPIQLAGRLDQGI